MSRRKLVATHGRKGKRGYVRVFTEPVGGRTLVRVQWREGGLLRTESWEHTRKGLAEARAFAEGAHERLVARIADELPAITLRELWDRYEASQEGSVRAKTITTDHNRWRKFELYAKRGTLASTVTLDTMDGFKKMLLENRHAPYQVSMHFSAVRRVFRFGVTRDLIPPTKVTEYRAKLSRDLKAKGPQMAEYSAEEAGKIIGALDPRDVRQWRAWAATVFFAYCGPRQNAALHLEWTHVDLEGRRLFYAAETDKMGRARWQPMPAPVFEAMLVAYGWRLRDGYTGRFVFYGVQDRRRQADKPWTYSAYNAALHETEGRAGVPHIKYRAAHGFRRGVAGNVFELTGSDKAAADWIGDESVKVVRRHYLLTREKAMQDVATKLGGDE